MTTENITTTAIDILVPEVDDLIGDYRRRFTSSGAGRMPAHVTLLYPFKDPKHVTDELLDDLRSFFSTVAPFSFSLANVGFFPRVAFLRPEPPDPVSDLIAALMNKYPEHKPYGEAFDRPPPPHVTFAKCSTSGEVTAVADELLRSRGHRLPVLVHVQEAVLTIIKGGISTPTYRFSLAKTHTDAGR